jgi:cysteine desulfuration protein SufE
MVKKGVVMEYNEIKEILSSISDPVMRLEMVMDFGRDLPQMPENAVCTEIHGCASRVSICRGGNNFSGTADSALVRGILAIILAMVQNKTPDQIREINLREEFKTLNLNLGAGRVNGVNSMIGFLENL